MKNLTPINELNAREIETMIGKAVCAWANYLQAVEMTKDPSKDPTMVQVALTAHMSEYEATIRILDLFVMENIYRIQHVVVAEAEDMLNS